ncbi:hypothetical protein [Hymenobacter sp. 5414T-23]|uniref:hypothetical protein n=1 Tax=Hymenobacter sp. 5414T-23 TaxID=2932252 RepID=UPI001FD201D5|nr:hypothetical protein [Hymenobacter sp. 5414T-23]UOQ81930.1 hypothetical protein MUN83_03835 [Hymenobacter sp. 5414T-23]
MTVSAARPKTRKKRLDPLEEAHLLYKDPARQAELAGLRYLTDSKPGLTRQAAPTERSSTSPRKGSQLLMKRS